MRALRFVYGLLIFVGALLSVAGCHFTITLNGDGTGDGNTSLLPDPKNQNGQDPNGQGPPLNDAQAARELEAALYTREIIYQGATITQTIQLPSGDIIDGLDRNTLPALPYAIPTPPWTAGASQLPPGVDLPVPDFEQYPELFDLVNTATPFQRPDFSAYITGETDAVSIEDYLARYQEGGVPSGPDRLYAALASPMPSMGVWGYANQFQPEVVPQSFSLMEFAVTCPAVGEVQEQIGIVISVDKYNAIGRGGKPRLHIEYATMKSGKRVYTWDTWNGKFQANPLSRHRPGEIVDVSVLDGKQVEHLMGIFQMPGTGDWWVGYDGDVLGYYPANLFTLLNKGACSSSWYVEVFNPNPPNRLYTEGGSGQHGDTGVVGRAAYVRNPQYFDPSMWWPVDAQEGGWMKPEVPDCYSRGNLQNGIKFLGGPGGKEAKCVWPAQ